MSSYPVANIVYAFLQVRYRLAEPMPDTFSIDAETGVISLARSLDFEDISSYQFVVEAYDRSVTSLTSNVTVA